MAQQYRVVIEQPATKTRAAKTWTWTADSNVIESIDVELQKEGKRIGVSQIGIWDPKANGKWWPICNDLPDPAFADVPVKIYLAKPGETNSASKLVFDGKLTSIQPGFPAPSNVMLVAHDRSIDLRLNARYKTYGMQTSVQIAKVIAADYDMEVDTSELTDIASLKPRSIEIGAPGVGRGMSDHAQLVRMLAADGLELYVSGKKIKVRKLAQVAYPHTFKPDDGIVIEFKPTINHVSSPGAGGSSKTPTPGGTKGTVSTAQGGVGKENDAAKTGETTHRTIPQAAKADHTGAHTESLGSNDGKAYQSRKRKDEATLLCWGLPDLGVHHLVSISGYGAKFDGDWHVKTVRHQLAGSAALTTSIALTRSPSGGAQKQIGIQPSGTKG